jgi:hypothetical protein
MEFLTWVTFGQSISAGIWLAEGSRVGSSARTLWRGFWDTNTCQFRALPGTRSA